MARLSTTAAVLLVAAMAVAGCGSESPTSTSPEAPPTATSVNTRPPDPAPTPSPTPSPSPTPETSVEWMPGLLGGEEASVDVGGRTQRIVCYGAGSPTVIFEGGGIAGGSLEWGSIQESLASEVRSCSYARYVDHNNDPQPPELSVADLRNLLEGAELPPPYLLVGHSLGGLYIRLFAEEYADSLVGLVFLDSSHPEQHARMDEPSRPDPIKAVFEAAQDTGPFEFPIVVLSADPELHLLTDEQRLIWMDMQSEIAMLSEDSHHEYVEGSKHHIHDYAPDLVVESIMSLVAKSRLP